MAIFVILLFAVCAALVIVSIISNLRAPIQTMDAQVVAKRTLVRGHPGTGTVTQYHYCTFEFSLGERREFEVSARQYGLLVERDVGRLTFQGTWFRKFERSDIYGAYHDID